jgi:MYXO-CTERM domain-containing protein
MLWLWLILSLGAPAAHAADLDGDAFDEATDCDDGDPSVYPGAIERCDGVDNDCDTIPDDLTSPDAQAFFRDADGDGWGSATEPVRACGLPEGFAVRAGDCDDGTDTVSPDQPEVCDGADNDCDAAVDEPGAEGEQRWFEDKNGDGVGNPNVYVDACEPPDPTGWALAEGCGCHAAPGAAGWPAALAAFWLSAARRRRPR